MSIKSSLGIINNQIRTYYREPLWGWGFRLAISVTFPLVFGWLTGMHEQAEWAAIAAESIAFVELKGNVGQRFRLLVSAMLLSLLFCTMGSLIGNVTALQLVGLYLVGMLCGLFKNLGERGMGLALSVYITFIITCYHPVSTTEELAQRVRWIFYGGLWTVLVGLGSFLFIRSGKPYRSTIANIWQSLSELAQSVGKGLDMRSPRSTARDIFLKEKEVRNAINNSLALFEETAETVSKDEKTKYALTHSRKLASIIGFQIIQLNEKAEELLMVHPDKSTGLLLYSIFRSIAQIGERMQLYVLSIKEEERVLVVSRINRMRVLNEQLLEWSRQLNEQEEQIAQKIYSLTERIARLVERSMEFLAGNKERRVFRSYSLTQTLNILHPSYFVNNLKQLLNPDSLTTRYSIRIGISVLVAGILSTWLFPDHGYWLIFTAIIVSQPYFGATLKKGIERSLGTIAGVVIGTGILALPFPAVARLLLVFFSSVFLIYFLRKQYSVSSIFITLMLVGLLSIEPHFNAYLLAIRIICTIIGAALAIIAGFLLLPTWDKELLPKYMAEALQINFKYFQNTFYREENKSSWTKMKRLAESKNANAFDSLLRYMQEPGLEKRKKYAAAYYMLTHNIRITRELNNYNGENELSETKIPMREKGKFIQILNQCDDLFRENARKYKNKGNKYIDENALKVFPTAGFITTIPTRQQFVFMEKMLIELKALHTSLVGNVPESIPAVR